MEMQPVSPRSALAHFSRRERVEENYTAGLEARIMKPAVEEGLDASRIGERFYLGEVVDVTIHEECGGAIDEQARGGERVLDAIGLATPIEARQVIEGHGLVEVASYLVEAVGSEGQVESNRVLLKHGRARFVLHGRG